MLVYRYEILGLLSSTQAGTELSMWPRLAWNASSLSSLPLMCWVRERGKTYPAQLGFYIYGNDSLVLKFK